jgi:hypothetical protein
MNSNSFLSFHEKGKNPQDDKITEVGFQESVNKKLMNRFMSELNVSGEQYGIKI